MRMSHFTESIPYHPGITARKGYPSSVGRGAPFILKAKSVSTCMAFSTGMLRVNETGPFERSSIPRSAPTNRTHLTLDSNPAFVNTDESETPVQLAVLTPP